MVKAIMSRTFVRGVLGLCLVGVLVFAGTHWWLLASSAVSPEDLDVRLTELRTKLTDDITKNPAEAYQRLKEGYTRDKFEESHVIAHMFGEILYYVRGVDGMQFCDTDFNFGCHHGFVSTAVASEGFDVARLLHDRCQTLEAEDLETCTHGLGHGLLEYLGDDQLVEALEACERIDGAGPLGGCMSGVFMGYNVSLSLDKESGYEVANRPLLDAHNPYSPCDTFTSPTFAEACFHELPRWWKQVYPEDYTVFGDYCGVLEGKNRTACYVGIAKVIPSAANFDVATSEALCAQVGERDVYANCLIRAAWSFYINSRDEDRAAALCVLAPEEMRGECPV